MVWPGSYGKFGERGKQEVGSGSWEMPTSRGSDEEHGHKEASECSAEVMKIGWKGGGCLAGLGAGTHVGRAVDEE